MPVLDSGRSDTDLIAAHVAGDSGAFGELVARHRDRMWAVALRTLRDPEEAADAVSGHTLSARDLKTKIDNGDNFLLVDVREQNEYEIVSIPGSVLIPKDDILSGEALASLPMDRQLVLHCKSGARSAEALAVLHKAGFADAVHVGGGVLAWVKQVDPSLPSY